MKRKMPAIFLGICAVLALAWGIGAGKSDNGQEEAAKKSPIAVTAVKAKVEEKQPGLSLTGTVEGVTSAIISSRYSGQVEELHAENGQMVEAGEALFRTDSQELSNNVRMAENGVRKASVNNDNIEANYRRVQGLYELGANSLQSLEAAQTQWAISRSEMDDAAANLAIAQKRLEDATVTSPVTGMVANKTVTLGQMVSAGTQLMTVEQIDAVYVVVQVEQKDIDKVDIGTPATVKVDAYPDKVFAGEIAVMNPVAGRENRLFAVKVRVENPEFLLMPGMFAELSLKEDTAKEALTVPRAAVLSHKGQSYVYVVDEQGIARKTNVTVGDMYDEELSIESGLQEGMLVITDNLDKIKDGDRVAVYGGNG